MNGTKEPASGQGQFWKLNPDNARDPLGEKDPTDEMVNEYDFGDQYDFFPPSVQDHAEVQYMSMCLKPK